MCIGISVGKEDNMEADENLAAADNGSPGEEKSEALSDFFMIITIWYYNSNRDSLSMMNKLSNLGISTV